MDDYSRTQIKNIPVSDLKSIVFDLVEELHLDCSQKIDTDLMQHTCKKAVELLVGPYSSWHWGDVRGVMRLGITGEYGKTGERINFQTISTWFKRAQQRRGANWADRSVDEAHNMGLNTVGDFKSISMRWKEFREFLEGENLWFVDNISEANCDAFHLAKETGLLWKYTATLVKEPDPEYLEFIKHKTLEQAKKEHERSKVLY